MDRKTSLFFDLCRLCLDKPGFSSIGIDLTKDIAWCTGVKVSASENLPKKICYTCLDVISNAKKLKEIANKNDMHLRSLFGDLEEEQISDEETNDNIETISSSLNVGIAVSSTFVDEDTMVERSNEHQPESTACSPKQNVKLLVRRDLFETSSVSSSTVKDVKFESEEKSPTNVKDMKYKKIKVKKDVFEYQCLVCKKRFDKWKKYYLHQRSHNKNIFCPLDGCGKKFAAKGDLEKHIRTHTGEKPYQCSICSKNFSQRGSLKAHMDAVHGESETVIGD